MPRTDRASLPVALVTGEQLEPGNAVPVELQDRADHAVMAYLHDKVRAVVLTGGITGTATETEAEALGRWMRARYREIEPALRYEKRSRTTAENVRFAMQALSILNPTEVWVYARASQVPKLRVLTRYFWGDRFGTVRFIPCADLKPLRFRWADRYLMTALARVDPEARWIGGLSSKPWFRRMFFYPTPSPKK